MDDQSSNIIQQSMPDTSVSTPQPKNASKASEPDALEAATVKQWIARIKSAKAYFDKDFQRMRDNMEFAAGFQRRGQATMDSDEIVINLVNRAVNQKVAQLYCRDPKAIAKRRKRMDFQVWDEDVQSLMTAMQEMSMAVQNGLAAQPDVLALIADFNQGQAWRKLVKKVGDALEIVYQYQCDSQQPNFKYQMKQLVRRVVTTGVGFVRLSCVAGNDMPLLSSGTDYSLLGMKKQLQMLVDQVGEEALPEEDPVMEQIRELVEAIQQMEASGEDQQDLQQKLVFDFPDPTAIIVDTACTSLKEFIGANWLAHEHIISVDDANSFFELRGDDAIQPGDGLITYSENGTPLAGSAANLGTDAEGLPPLNLVCVWEVFDRTNRNKFFVVDGYKKFAQAPAPVQPCLKRFWPVFALTFNDIEVKRGLKATIYPPSDVQLMKPAQQEWNRTRQEFRNQRAANIPFYLAMEGVMVKQDKDSFADHENSEIVYVKGLPKDGDVNKMVMPFRPAPIDPNLYTIEPLKEDMQLAAGFQQADMGSAQAHVTATNSSIAEQSRINGVSSNADDVDDFLTAMAESSGELILMCFEKNTVVRIAGQGASVWPDTNKTDFVNELYLTIVAASSGRPNRAVDIANAERLMPLVMSAMANPQLWPFVEYMMKILDDRLSPSDFMPSTLQMPQGGAGGQGQGKEQGASESISIKLTDLSPQERAQALAMAGIKAGGPVPSPTSGSGSGASSSSSNGAPKAPQAPSAPAAPSSSSATIPAPSGPQSGQAAHTMFGGAGQNGGSQPIPVQRTA